MFELLDQYLQTAKNEAELLNLDDTTIQDVPTASRELQLCIDNLEYAVLMLDKAKLIYQARLRSSLTKK